MFTVIGNIIACVFWGVLISSILTGLLFCLPKAIHMRFGYTPPYILLLIIFFLFSAFQATLLTGGFKAKKYIKTAENLAISVLAETGYSPESLPPDEFGTLTGKLKEALPIPEASLHDAIGKLKQSGKQPSFAGPAGTRSRQNDTDRNQPIYMEKKRMDNSGFSSLRFSFGFECSETGPEKKRTKEEL